MQYSPAFTRLNENIEQATTAIRQLQQCEQASHRATRQKDETEANTLQLLQRLNQVLRDCQQDMAQAAALFPQIATTPKAIHLAAKVEKLQGMCQYLIQQATSNYQTTQEKHHYEVSACKLARQAEQLIYHSQNEIGSSIPTRQVHPAAWAQASHSPNYLSPVTAYAQQQQQQPKPFVSAPVASPYTAYPPQVASYGYPPIPPQSYAQPQAFAAAPR